MTNTTNTNAIALKLKQDDEDEDQDEEQEFEPYNMQQKVTFIEQQITNIYSFLQKNFPKQNVMASST
jgi:hypothetical protein